MKNLFFTLLFFAFTINASAQLQSPDAFLGYRLGSRFTPHYKVVAYCEHVAQNSKMVQLQQYGETYEHRPLLAAFVGTEANIGQLEKIRDNNLQLARQSVTAGAGSTNTPAIIWLSYNVHGNEPTSTEAAMATLYALAEPSNAATKAWLQNTIVVIDPCENPDGRDRYVNWYNSVAGKNYNVQPICREHIEPWPRGRSNHYNFDLNRDWAWQTQVESLQRMALYNKWLPQVHVDFHEQGYNAPYYFAPAAEPFHDIITKWQREFQFFIGKNNAKYFDQNNWLYFTRERFDLFYPSYGDTYPMYNGSIGMTYEQGGISGGLGVITSENDTLTFVQRVQHHFVASLATIETSANYGKALLTHFKQYFDDAVAGKMGTYKTYIIKYKEADAQRILSLKELLNKNNIQYGTSSGIGKGLNYYSLKEENFSITKEDLVISAVQAKAALVQSLFEPNPHLSDSATYDITAWAMPYAYGLTAFASNQVFNIITGEGKMVTKNASSNPYGYVFPLSGNGSIKAVAKMLKDGIRLRFAEKAFTAGNKKFANGSVIILKNGNRNLSNVLWEKVREIANANNLQLSEVNSGMVDEGADFGSSSVHSIKPPKVVLISGDNVNANAMGEVWSYFEEELNYPVSLVNAQDMGRLSWNNVDVLVLADGNYEFLKNKEMAEQLEAWVRSGGKIVALERAVKHLSKQSWSRLKPKESDEDQAKEKNVSLLSKYANSEKDAISQNTPGAIFKVWLDNTHPLMFGYPDFYYTLKMDDVLYQPLGAEDGWNTGIIKSEKQMAGFVGAKLAKNLNNGVLFAVQDLGRGNIIYLTDDVLFRRFWENGKQIFFNAVFLVGQ
ncbi:MAG: zinc carboxypeptidase [Chitinophagaceae bacterium]|nr:zinc carboxypeptidase [Chitinophagaceae bacterium]